MIPAKSGERLDHLDAARGIASVLVVFHHFGMAFVPVLDHSVARGGLLYTPLYALINGSAAVVFFFMLSGYVLSVGFVTGRLGGGGDLAASVIKRLPRLALPAGASLLAGLCCVALLPAYHLQAAGLGGSQWLANFGNATLPAVLVPSFADALRQSLTIFLDPEAGYYNTNLWTMFYELWGSLIVFLLLAPSVLAPATRARRKVPQMFTRLATLLCGAALLAVAPLLAPFAFGSLIASLRHSGHRGIALGPLARIALVLVAIIALSTKDLHLLTLGSAAIMILLLQPGFENGPMSGRFGRWLGRISFPLYLVHTLVILTVSSALFAALTAAGIDRPLVLAICAFATVAVSLVACQPFVLLERWWIPTLNRIVRQIVRGVANARGGWPGGLGAVSPVPPPVAPHGTKGP